ncbi:hypothetical protein [Rufibacter hautae]|uniref:STAS/SEC14 domain-containing protein n=1 Tax=Rufibacter hautae TaxID=2595005 RepID=A0A5B6TGI6_9BACT|nr:hypothetical protein [Rufibacter hautae]KAA3439772.1 hypothetical protein FOA19_03590 [Rufibacter hautae]
MIIYNSAFLTLDFDPSVDILSVTMPPVNDILVPEINRSFAIIVENVRNYDIKRLLFDARETRVDVQEEVFAPVITQFVLDLATTRVQKVARVSSTSVFREHVVSKVFNNNVLPIQFESFSEIEPAIEWLKH